MAVTPNNGGKADNNGGKADNNELHRRRRGPLAPVIGQEAPAPQLKAGAGQKNSSIAKPGGNTRWSGQAAAYWRLPVIAVFRSPVPAPTSITSWRLPHRPKERRIHPGTHRRMAS